jgi:transcription antitermination factor NusG
MNEVTNGNLAQVRDAPAGITGVKIAPPEPATEMCLILVKPSFEQEARDNLRRHGVGAWWPNYRKEITAKDRQTGKRFKRNVLAGVLPGVILSPARISGDFFAALDLAPGVINVAQKPNGHWLLLGDVDIVLIHKIEQGLNRPPAAKVVHNFKRGDKVRCIDDVYRRLAGVVTKCQRNGYIDIEVNMWGRMQPLTVLPHQIEKD